MSHSTELLCAPRSRFCSFMDVTCCCEPSLLSGSLGNSALLKKVQPVKGRFPCIQAPAGSLDFLKSKECVEHPSHSTRPVACHLLVTSNNAHISLSFGSSQGFQIQKLVTEKCLLGRALLLLLAFFKQQQQTCRDP